MKYIAVLLLGLAFAQGDRFDDVFTEAIDLQMQFQFEKGAPILRTDGGVEVSQHSMPYQVGLITQLNHNIRSTFCGGSLIKKNVVLTAAHCVDGAQGPTEVILGAHKIREQEKTQKILSSDNCILHKDWDRETLSNDIALIILPEEVELNDNIGLVSLPADNSKTYEGHKARASGWTTDIKEGRYEEDFSDQTLNSVLRQVELDVLSDGICKLAFWGMTQESHICTTGSGGKSTCSGDPGGPLVVDGIQIGIGSFALFLACEMGLPAAYTRTSSFLDWIEENSS